MFNSKYLIERSPPYSLETRHDSIKGVMDEVLAQRTREALTVHTRKISTEDKDNIETNFFYAIILGIGFQLVAVF